LSIAVVVKPSTAQGEISMNKWKHIETLQGELQAIKNEIAFLEPQVMEIKKEFLKTLNEKHFELLSQVQVDISTLKSVEQSIQNAINWAMRYGVKGE
jgi:hypothetical protein